MDGRMDGLMIAFVDPVQDSIEDLERELFGMLLDHVQDSLVGSFLLLFVQFWKPQVTVELLDLFLLRLVLASVAGLSEG